LQNLSQCVLAIDNSPQLYRAWAIIYKHFPTVSVNWNKIYPDKLQDNLYLGSLRAAQNPQTYSYLGVTRVLSCGRGLQIISPLPPNVEQMEVPLDDNEEENLQPFFTALAETIQKWRDEHRIVLVHCFAGISRSVATVVAYLMLKHRNRMDQALEYVKSIRPSAQPNSGFMTQLRALDNDLLSQGHFVKRKKKKAPD